jgi:hypothetical protein
MLVLYFSNLISFLNMLRLKENVGVYGRDLSLNAHLPLEIPLASIY